MSKFEKKAQKPKDLFSLEGISCLSFNGDFTQVAISKKDSRIYIYSCKDLKKPSTWELLHILEEHVHFISGLDWNAKTNKIISCSHDKTCNIWTYADKQWTSSCLVATVKLGYLTCSWNDRGDKLCCGTSSKNLLMGYFDKESEWWTSIPVKKDKKSPAIHGASVLICRFSPDSLYLLSGSADCKVCVTSVYYPEVDDQFLGGKKPDAFGSTIYEVQGTNWINDVCFNSKGNLIFIAEQKDMDNPSNKENRAGIVTCYDYMQDKKKEILIDNGKAMMVRPNGENSIFVVGYDRSICQYDKEGEKWVMKKLITKSQLAGNQFTSMANLHKVGDSVQDRIKGFQSMKLQNKELLSVSTKQFSDYHGGQITSLTVKGKDMITSDIGGYIKFWAV